MARTPNRYLKLNSDKKNNIVNSKKFLVGNYVRLSVDSDYTGSDSIENQLKLAEEYISERDDMVIVSEYIDNGKTGTNFKRPAFDKMMSDIKEEIINCIIVKDLSRFGREYLEAGNYIEKVFPFLGVRFISINDRYDSENPSCSKELLNLSLKNLMNQMYAMDISKKVETIYQMKQEKEIFYRTATIPYGYKMDKNSNYTIDEAAADIIKKIFEWYQNGKSKYTICNLLNELQIMPPKQYKESKRIYRNEQDKIKGWKVSTIDRILKNPVYIGTIIRHKTKQCIAKGISNQKIQENEWVKIENNHKPIISAEQFNAVNNILINTARNYNTYFQNRVEIEANKLFETNVFYGKLFCADCKNNMVRVNAYKLNHGIKSMYKNYVCSTHRNMPQLCDTKSISEKLLCDIVFNTIKTQLKSIKKLDTIIKSDIECSFDNALHKIEKNSYELKNALILLEQKYINNYSEFTLHKIESNSFQNFRNIYYKRRQYLNTELENLEDNKQYILKCQRHMKKLLKIWLRYDNIVNIKWTENIMDIFVKNIFVHTNNKIEITLNYMDSFRILEQYCKEGGTKRWNGW